MRLQTLLATSTLALTSSAQAPPAAIVTIEASHGGAGQDLTNQTVTIPLTAIYTNATALAEVSTLYLVDARGVPLTSVSCTPFRHTDGTGTGGLTFDSTTPSYLSTNTVQVGSIVCISTDINTAPPSPSPGHHSLSPTTTSTINSNTSATAASSSSGAATDTSTLAVVTTGQSTTQTKTQTTVATASSAAQTTQASSSSTQVPQATGNAASNLGLSSELFGGLALAGFGLAFAL